MTFGHVPPPYGALWPAVEALLAPAVERGGNDWREVRDTLADGRSQLWLTMDPAPINATVTRMDGDTLEIWLCGGAVLHRALRFLDTILKAARESGAVSARIIGRKGWDRALRGRGWRRCGDELVKDLA